MIKPLATENRASSSDRQKNCSSSNSNRCCHRKLLLLACCCCYLVAAAEAASIAAKHPSLSSTATATATATSVPTTARSRRALATTARARLVFSETLAQAHPNASSVLGDPCGAGAAPPAALMPDGAEQSEALTVLGRERGVMAMVGNTLAAVIDMDNELVSQTNIIIFLFFYVQ